MKLFEGILKVPVKVSKQLRDVAEEAYSIVISGEADTLKRTQRDLVLDFSGTRFHFLDRVAKEYPLKVRIRGTRTPDVYYEDQDGYGLIVLNIPSDIKSFEQLYKVDIDHEIVHYIQTLIGKAKGLKHVGGLGKKNILDNRYDVEGYKDEHSIRRRTHGLREVEYQAIANSVLKYAAILKYENPEYTDEDVMRAILKISDEIDLLRRKDPKKFNNLVKGLYTALQSPDFDELTNSFEDYSKFIKKNRMQLIKKLVQS